MRRPRARLATTEPILPQPIMPSVLPVISAPMNLDFSHLPAWVEVSAAGIWRASAIIMAMACSAVVIELPNGVFMTTTPFEDATGMSTLSTPMPARPITLSFSAFSSTSAVTLVAERMARPSYSPMTDFSFSGSLPRSGWKSTSTPLSRKICTAASESLSEIRTLGMSLVSLHERRRRRAAAGAGMSAHGIRGGRPRRDGRGRAGQRLRGRPSRWRTPSRARASARGCPRSRPWRRTRCAGPRARRGSRSRRRPPPPAPAASPSSW